MMKYDFEDRLYYFGGTNNFRENDIKISFREYEI